MKLLLFFTLVVGFAPAQPGLTRDTDPCCLCLEMINELDELLHENPDYFGTTAMMKNLCICLHFLLPAAADICDGMVQSDLSTIKNGLIHDTLSPQDVCSEMTACKQGVHLECAPTLF